ncbi:hypothetical protein V8C37DRAFT_373339 [Trichoderma ceciliae]
MATITMPPKADGDQQRQCWECLRRRLACDGYRPVCNCCRSASIVCPGYEDRRPLTWVTPGNVHIMRIRRTRTGVGATPATAAAPKKHRLQIRPPLLSPPPEMSSTESKSRTSSNISHGKSTEDEAGPDVTILGDNNERDDDDEEDRDDEGENASNSGQAPSSTEDIKPQTRATSLAPISQQRRWSKSTQWRSTISMPPNLQSGEFEIMDAVDYYNHHIFPAINSNQLIPNAYSKRFDKNRIPELIPSDRHSLISISIGYRILAVAQVNRPSINPRNAGPASDLWTSFFRHIGLALTALNNEIRNDPVYYLVNIFRSIHLIASSELFLLNSPHWRAHVVGFLSILQQQGGLGTLMQRPGNTKLIVLSFLVTCIVANTTSSLENQITEATCLDPKELYNLYKTSIYPPFLCPHGLFLDILYINRLRLRIPTTSVIYSLPSIQVTVCDILKHIHDFSAVEWIESSGFPNRDEFLLLSNIFQAAVALYASLTLPCTSKFHIKRSCHDLKRIYRARLFNTLRTAIGSPIRTQTIYWPVVVAGVVASSGTDEEQMLVEEHLNIGINEPYSGSGSLKALAILRRAWAYGKTEWDDCFNEPNVILFS